ncbi:tRNA pseudouridine(55) synthase TruB [Candidatus Saccharibacteria bacterium]|nr:MAG: tRNA pseudouridine(55) synthase TruB [Candidatus Saccharibacteria bacterium]
MEQFDQIILADKPAGISSFGVVARVRRQLSEQAGRKIKVGHTGTLDPFATGLMILLSGTFTRRAGEFSKLDKVYEATIRLGAISSTGDPEGEITEQLVQDIPSEQQVRQTIKTFLGKITQTPPVFSAIKINGQRAYKLARAGQAVEMPSREVEIYSIELLSYEYPHIKIRAHVSSGTYIRTLAQDIGDLLGTGAYATKLRRTKVGSYDIDNIETIKIIK